MRDGLVRSRLALKLFETPISVARFKMIINDLFKILRILEYLQPFSETIKSCVQYQLYTVHRVMNALLVLVIKKI